MAIARAWQAGAECSLGTSYLYEFDAWYGTPALTGTRKTGSLAYNVSANQHYFTKTLSASYTQMRVGFHFMKHTYDTRAGTGQWVIRLQTGGTARVGLYRVANQSYFRLWVNSVPVATNIYFNLNTWYFIGIDIKKAVSGGWVHVYVNGVLVASKTGNTAADTINTVRFGPNSSSSLNRMYFIFDDFYFDNTLGEGATASPPDKRFEYITANGNGNHSQWDGSDGNQVDNYQQIDERPVVGADENRCQAVDEKDSYAMTTKTLGAGWAVRAIIPYAVAAKADATANLVALMTRENGVDEVGSAQSLSSVAWQLRWQRFANNPGGSSWDQDSLNAVEVGVVGKGTF